MNVLFICWGSTDGLSHWRSLVPARAMNADMLCWNMNREIIYNDCQMEPQLYDVAIVQTCWNDWQLELVKRLQSVGVRVLLNVDDWIKGIGRRAKTTMSHDMWKGFTKRETIEMHEKILSAADGILASTPVLAEKLRQYNKVGLAPNGIDLHRYSTWRDPVRDDGLIIGWAGGVGHTDVIRSIAEPVSAAIADLNSVGVATKLAVVGQDERHAFGQMDALHMRWADKYIYPQYLSCFDISLAPSRDDSFFRYKSQLRLYEAAALGTPTLGGELYETEMDGFGRICRDRDDWYDQIMELGRSQQLRDEIRQYCYDNIDRFTIENRIGTWRSEMTRLLSGSSTSGELLPFCRNTKRTSRSGT